MSQARLPSKVILDIEAECTHFENMVRFFCPEFEHDGYEVATAFINALTHWEEMEQCIQACVDDYKEVYKQIPSGFWCIVVQFVRYVYYKLSLVTGQSGWIPYQSHYGIVNGGGLLLELTENKKEYIDVIHSRGRQL